MVYGNAGRAWTYKEYVEKYDELLALWRRDLRGMNLAKQVNAKLQAENKRLKEKNHWIPISEKLPLLKKAGKDGSMQSSWVHITDGKNVIDAYYYDYTKREAKPNYATGKGWYCSGMYKESITHWKPMTLPKKD